MNVGFIQPSYPAQASVGTSAATVECLFSELDRASCDLVVLPEYGNCAGLNEPAALCAFAEAGADAFLHRVAEAARRRRFAVAANVLQRLDSRLANVTWLFDAAGAAVGRYVKTHLSPFERDTLKLAAGEEAVTLAWNGIRIGFLTCFDIYFAEFAERLAVLGPDLVVFPSHQRAEPGDVLTRQAAGRALDMEAYLVRASYARGSDGTGSGHSLIAAPDGRIVLDAGQEAGFFACELDPARKRVRPRSFGLPPLASRQIVEANRRPHLYRVAGFGAGVKVSAPYPRVVAHRGLSGVCPENTLPAFAAAVALGADEIELDVWAARDGELVVCHDEAVDRTSNGHGLIRELDWAELRRLDAGSWRGPDWAGVPFCRLDEVMDQLGSRIVMNIHIKEPGADGLVIRRTRELAAARGLLKEIYIAGDQDVLACAVKVAPEIARCCLAGGDRGARMLEYALDYGCARVQFWNPNLTTEDIARAHGNGIVCNLFSGDRPDTAEEAVRACELGIDAVLTNWANHVLPALQKCRNNKDKTCAPLST